MIDGLATPHPLGLALPGVYHGDPLTQDLMAAIDTTLAPVISTLDNIDSYVDPALAPADFVDWLSSWVGVAAEESWPEGRRRDLPRRAIIAYQWRGTIRGVSEQVAMYTGVHPEIVETGGVAGSLDPDTPLPGSGELHALVRLRVDDLAAIDLTRLGALVTAAMPAHVTHDVEVVAG